LEYDSKKQLKKVIDKTLENTNWRLMSAGVRYRVGYLNGSLRCYETEDDLIKLMDGNSRWNKFLIIWIQ